MGSIFSTLAAPWSIREKSWGNIFYSIASYMVIATFFVGLPIDYYVRNYLLNKVPVKKRRSNGKKNDSEMIA